MNDTNTHSDSWDACPAGELQRMVHRAQSQRRAQTAIRTGGALSLAIAVVFVGFMVIHQWVPGWGLRRGGIWCADCMELMTASKTRGLNAQEGVDFSNHLENCKHCKEKYLEMSTQALEDNHVREAVSLHASLPARGSSREP